MTVVGVLVTLAVVLRVFVEVVAVAGAAVLRLLAGGIVVGVGARLSLNAYSGFWTWV